MVSEKDLKRKYAFFSHKVILDYFDIGRLLFVFVLFCSFQFVALYD